MNIGCDADHNSAHAGRGCAEAKTAGDRTVAPRVQIGETTPRA